MLEVRISWAKVVPQLRALTPPGLRDVYFPLPEEPAKAERVGA